MIHCFYGDRSELENEKKQLNQLLSQMQHVVNPEKWVYIIYNAMWNGNEVDFVCFTSTAIVVGDLKNYSGKVEGGENGPWLIETQNNGLIEVKGGSKINPYVQIRANKFAVKEKLEALKILNDEINLFFIAGLIVFNEIEQSDIELTTRVRKWFDISDISHVGEWVNNKKIPNFHIAELQVQEIIKKLRLQQYKWETCSLKKIKYDPFIDAQSKIPYSVSERVLEPKSLINNHGIIAIGLLIIFGAYLYLYKETGKDAGNNTANYYTEELQYESKKPRNYKTRFGEKSNNSDQELDNAVDAYTDAKYIFPTGDISEERMGKIEHNLDINSNVSTQKTKNIQTNEPRANKYLPTSKPANIIEPVSRKSLANLTAEEKSISEFRNQISGNDTSLEKALTE